MPDRMVVISRVVVAIPSGVSVQQNPFPLVWSLHPDCRYIQSRYNQNLLYMAIVLAIMVHRFSHYQLFWLSISSLLITMNRLPNAVM